jgi:hypothetical protein
VPDASGRYKLTPEWSEVESALGLSLRQITEFSENPMIVHPLFGVGVAPTGAADVFVAVPFLEELQIVFDHHIKAVAGRLSLKVRRADDFFAPHSIMQDVWNAIVACKLVIADCTGRMPMSFMRSGLLIR